ncbi:hypothetical protein [Dyadobacter tibetensis]|uniref:hypothetical protein n=1 Tax=Dyadobacter tibetensis TaxID=1211851 RepID=UPI00046E9C53|nr:hypothetical protein [Dyadobacter tibetensis]
MIQHDFANKAKQQLLHDPGILGLAAAGSWLTNQIDEYSDLDLILVTKEKISDDKSKMVDLANRFGTLLSCFTGEHVGEPRLLICLYDDPLLHVDIKFLTLSELNPRIETPYILLDREGLLQLAFEHSDHQFPLPDFQWIEDRFWTWIHYTLLKIGRGEYFEAFDFFGFIRMVVLGPLLHIKNGKLPRGVRKVERELNENDLMILKTTLANYERQSLLESLKNTVHLYRSLRESLFDDKVILHARTELRVMEYLTKIEQMKS